MRLSEPRIEPLGVNRWSPAAAEVMAPIVESGPPSISPGWDA